MIRKVVFKLPIIVFLLLTIVNPVNASCSGIQKDFKCLEGTYQNVLQSVIVPGASLGLFVMMLSGGIKWLTSSGDPKDLENAKGRITFAVFGLTLIILAYFIIIFVGNFTGVSMIEDFKIRK